MKHQRNISGLSCLPLRLLLLLLTLLTSSLVLVVDAFASSSLLLAPKALVRQPKQYRDRSVCFVTSSPTQLPPGYQRGFYQYKEWNLTYRYKLPPLGAPYQAPILLIHPVGIGLASWFWEKFMEDWNGDSAVYAVDLVGCGIADGGDAWNPDEQGMTFPLGWALGCEALLNQVILPQAVTASRKASRLPFLGKPSAGSCTVVAQGGLAPVGVVLAARNPDTVDRLVLTSPPSWKDMVTPVPEVELERNYSFLRSTIGSLAFGLLESKWALEFFSNAFLFADKCDDLWLDRALEEACPAARPPVQVFNSGFCMHRSFEEELATLVQPTLVLQGDQDTTRIDKRNEYATEMRDCQIQTITGQNVLPWESPLQVCTAVRDFQRS